MNPNVVTTPPVILPVGAPNNPFTAPAALIGDFTRLGMVQNQLVTNTYRLVGDLMGTAAGCDLDGTAVWMYAALNQTVTGALDPGALVAAAAGGFNFATASPQLMAQTFAPAAGIRDTNTMEVVDLYGTREAP